MKLVLSRKGFDSSSGGVPSPILPDSRIVSLPIPDDRSAVRYGDIRHDDIPLGPLVSELTNNRVTAAHGAHIDPDLQMGSLPRQPGWRPIFGQSGSAQAHLRNQGVTVGDLFLFFGLFRPVMMVDGAFKWNRRFPPVHLIWGWMQVGEMLPVSEATTPQLQWARYHPHFQRLEEKNNLLYLARERLKMGTHETELPGAGVFADFSKARQLTATDADRVSMWELPRWCYPHRNRVPFSYHSDRARWRREKLRTVLQSVARGQEFVMDTGEYPQALPWAEQIISHSQRVPQDKFKGGKSNAL